MKAVISSLLLTSTAVANAANCDVMTLTGISKTTDAVECKDASNFVVPVESTEGTILTNLELFCKNDACKRVLESLKDINECLIDDVNLRKSVVDPIDAVCSTTRALKAADGSHVHSSGMDMGSATAETEDSHGAPSSTASSGAEDSHDATSTSSEAYDSHDTDSSSSASAEGGDDDDDDSHDTASSKSTTTSSTVDSSTGSKATSSNSTSTTPAPNASGT